MITGGLRSGIPGEEFTTYDNSNSDINFNTEYFFRVKSFRQQGVFSANSNVVSITTPEIVKTSPPRITNLTVSGNNVTFTIVNTDAQPAIIIVNYNGVPIGFEFGPVLTNESITSTLPFTTQSTLFALAQSTGKAISESDSRQFAAEEEPATPSITSIVTNVGNTVINWSYSGPFIDGFYILRNPTLQGNNNFDVLIGNISPRIFRFTDFSVGSGISFQYRVVAFNRIAEKQSAIFTIQTVTMTPTPPSNLTVSQFALAGANNELAFELNFQINSAGFEDGFNIIYLGNIVGGSVKGVPKARAVVDGIVGQNINYNFTVVAYNEFGNSAPSNVATATISL